MRKLATNRFGSPRRTAFRGVAFVGGVIVWAAAAMIGAVLAVVSIASLMVILFMAGVLAVLATAGLRARRTVRAPADPELIEARNIGGHSWVAYGWDGRR